MLAETTLERWQQVDNLRSKGTACWSAQHQAPAARHGVIQQARDPSQLASRPTISAAAPPCTPPTTRQP